MTQPTISYGHGFLTDCDDTTNWTENNQGLTSPSIAVRDGDVFRISGTCDDAGDEYVQYTKDITNISSTTYTKYLVRWRTQNASSALGLKVELVFTAGSQVIVGTADVPAFSTSWTVNSGTITTGKTIDTVKIEANDYPNSLASGTTWVEVDFILLYKGIFTFPFISELEEFEFNNQVALLDVPGRVGQIPQYLGAESPIIMLSGEMDTNTSWVGTNSIYGEYMQTIWKEMHSDKWQWLTSDNMDCKVIPLNLRISKVAGSHSQRTWDMLLKKYDLSSGDASSWTTKAYFGW